MTPQQREHAMSEAGFLRAQLAELDPVYVLERFSFEARLEKVTAQLAADDAARAALRSQFDQTVAAMGDLETSAPAPETDEAA